MTDSIQPTPVEQNVDHDIEQDDADEQGEPDELDLDAIERDLDGVQAALARLADGSYWTDEVTGEPLTADLLAADPLARRA